MSNSPKSVLDILLNASSSKIDAQVAQLEKEIAREKDQRKQERFCWFMALLVVINCVAFPHLTVKWFGIFIFLLDVFFVIGFAKFCGIEEVSEFIDKILALCHKYLDAQIAKFQSNKKDETLDA